MTDQSWRKVFVGREDELKLLDDAWHKAKDGQPQFVTFLAETGVGKTRLVQHFYSRLTREEDPDQYWPDTMDSAAASLAINPPFPDAWKQGGIPWLWWGLRASDLSGCNSAESLGCAIQDAAPKLEPHVQSILSKREKRSLATDLGIGLVKISADIAADMVTFGIFTKSHDFYELGKKYKEELARQQSVLLSINQIIQQKKSDLSEIAFDYLKTVLNKKDKDAATVPVILVLDDAQWFDQTSLNFVEKLWRAASKNGWPLLIVATHWMREWRQDEQQLNSGQSNEMKFDQPPLNLVHLIHRNAHLLEDWRPYELPTMQANVLQPVLEKAFPGLTPNQQQMLLDRVGGNPQFLDDLIRWMQENPRQFFKKRDCGRPLSSSGEKQIYVQLNKGHMALVRERFDALEEDMRDLLGFGSYQGMTFVEPLIIDVVNQMYGEDDADWQGHFGQAMHPYAVINRISKVTDEFIQRNAYEIAKEHLHQNEEEKGKFSKILLLILCQWYESGKIVEQSSSERGALLTLFCKELDALPEHADLLVRVQMDLVELYNDSDRASDAAKIALQILDRMPDDGWPLQLLSGPLQNSLINTLMIFPHQQKAMQLCKPLIKQLQGSSQKNLQWQRSLIVAHLNRGNLFQQLYQSNEALEDYSQAIYILSAMRNSMDEHQISPEWEHYFACALASKGCLFNELNQSNKALHDFNQAIDVLRGLRDLMGEKQFLPEWKESLAGALRNRGSIQMKNLCLSKALDDHGEAILILRGLRGIIDEGIHSKCQEALGLTLINRGIVFQDQNQFIKALDDFTEGMEILTGIRDSLEEHTPAELEMNLGTVLMNRGVLLQKLNQNGKALDCTNEAIHILTGICGSMGELQFLPAWKKDLATAFMNAGVYFSELNKLDEALAAFNSSFSILTDLNKFLSDRFPPEWRAQLAGVLINRGITFQCFKQYSEALVDYDEAILILIGLRSGQDEQFMPKWKNDMAIVYMHRGDLLQKLKQPSEALVNYNEATLILKCLHDMPNKQIPFEWQKEILVVHLNTGNLFKELNQPPQALASYNAAISTELRDVMNGELTREWQKFMAIIYMSRRNLFESINMPNEALADYNEAIRLFPELSGNHLSLEKQKALAATHMNKGNSFKGHNQFGEALAEYKEVISLLTGLRDVQGDQQFTPEWEHYLAVAHLQRGVLLQSLNKPIEALDECSDTIRILRGMFNVSDEQQLLSDWQHNMACAHMLRGNCFSDINQHNEALSEFNLGICILTELCDSMGEPFQPLWQDNLYKIHKNRGNSFRAINQYSEAFADYKKAIHILGALREAPCEQHLQIRQHELDTDCCSFANFLVAARLSFPPYMLKWFVGYSCYQRFCKKLPESWRPAFETFLVKRQTAWLDGW